MKSPNRVMYGMPAFLQLVSFLSPLALEALRSVWSGVKNKSMSKFWNLLVALCLTGVAFSQQEFSPGKTVERLTCVSDSSQSYALYLPSAYDPAKKWPILYCLDARAKGMIPLDLFREAAEKYGYVIASSNNSMSDDPTAANQVAMKALWEDTHKRFSIDEKRVYATGFSGGARLACDLGSEHSLAGVIGCGAGFPPDRPPTSATPFAYFGTIGARDFNFYEMRILDASLQTAGIPHNIRSFDGEHEWPPATLGTEAIEWMELQSMKKGTREKDASLIQSWMAQKLATAKSLQSAGNIYDAAVTYDEVAADFDGLAFRKSSQLPRCGAEFAPSEKILRALATARWRDTAQRSVRQVYPSARP